MNNTRNVYIALCGLVCSECPAYIGTKNNDHALIERTAREWSAMHKVDVKPEHVWCEGCTTEGGRKSSHCEHGCEIRKCAEGRIFFSCALCDERSDCAKIAPIGHMAPGTVTMLDALCSANK
jgi:hypothetical protein